MIQLSKAVQQTVVGEGLAAGCLRIGVIGVPASSAELDAGFRRAWAKFAYAETTFPAIKATLARNDVQTILSMSSRRHSAVAVWHDQGAWWSPEVTQTDWTPDDVVDHLSEVYEVTPTAWDNLAGDLADALGRGRMRHK